eukprot:TRINITY_DN121605_c0_g1_i1.p1 TRINITY_DN121605_c0_g1~~TRINITY_DN121605_c0_g1_i1.p1  ORF type:complete len:579 (-),score=75.87 TRINITY_DN121605_c0_g1_i1:101-1837(-)
MPSLLVRLNLPGFRSPEPFRLASAPPTIAGLACAVLEEIGGFSKEELDGVCGSLDRVPLTLLGELCAGQLVELASDAELGVFLATAESPRGEPAIIEVRPKDAPMDSFAEESNGAASQPASLQPASPQQQAPTLSPSVALVAAPAPVSSMPTTEVPPVPAQNVPRHGSAASGYPSPSTSLGQTSAAGGPAQVGDWGSVAAARRDRARTPESARKHACLRGPSGSRQPLGLQQRQQPAAVMGHEQHGPLPGTSMSVWEGSSASASSTAPPAGPNDQTASQASPLPRLNASPPSGHLRAPSSDRSEGRESRSQTSDRPRREGSVYMRLYQEKDDRRRRKQEAELRFYETEENTIRESAQRALGRAPSPGRAHSPGRARQGGGPRTNTPPPPQTTNKPPSLPAERPSSAGPRRRQPAADTGGSSAATGLLAHRRSSTPTVSPGNEHGLRQGAVQSVGKPGAADVPLEKSLCHKGNSSFASAVTESEAVEDPAMQSLRGLCLSQQQRIEFLEQMHQQSLSQLRKCREELARAQQQRFQEADKVLRLEQLLSEMQVQRFEGDVQMMSRWQDWVQRSRAILQDD